MKLFTSNMKAFTYILSILALILITFNLTQIDYKELFSDKNTIALITVMAGSCTILLLAILRISKKIEVKEKRKR